MKRELTKEDVYVVVDTPKKAKKLKKVLEMFGEEVYQGKVFHDDGYPYYTYISGFNYFVGCKYETGSNISEKFKKVSIKELRNILAKEHLITNSDYGLCSLCKSKLGIK